MKKGNILLISLLVVGLGFKCNSIENLNAATTSTYVADFSKGVPSGFELNQNCDIKNVTVTSNDDNTISIKHTNSSVSESLYYGALLTVKPFENPVSDFEASLTFKYDSYQDASRWIALMYHTKTNATGKISGYDMNYRVNGYSAESTVTSAPKFTDSLNTNSNISGSDLKYHTLKITCNGTSMSHYIDNNLVVSYERTDYCSSLGKDYTYGDFAIIVNRSQITIKEFKITGQEVIASESVEDLTYARTFKPSYNFVGDFSINAFIDSKEELDNLVNLSDISEEEPRVDNAIFYVDKEMNVTDSNLNSLGKKLKDVYNESLKGYIIPVVYLKDEEITESFIKYHDTTFNLIDMAIISSKPEIVKDVKTKIPSIRGIIDFTDNPLKTYYDYVKITNMNYALTALINQNDVTFELVDFIQARFKTVWVNNKTYSPLNVINQITMGVYGIVTDNYLQAIEDCNSLPTAYSEYNLNRNYYNIAHRGLCYKTYENSLEGFKEAYELGATHIELDVQRTSDGKLIVMHDDSISRTTNYTGGKSISAMTLAEIQEYKIVTNYLGDTKGDGVNIPTLQEVFEEFKDTDLVMVVEIKTNNANAVLDLKALLDEYDLYKNVVVISFNQSQIAKMKTIIPEIPTADLNAYTYADFKTTSSLVTLGSLNCTIDNNNGYISSAFTKDLAMRGFSNFGWTYAYPSDIMNAALSGNVGVTNNSAEGLASIPKYIQSKSDYVISYEGEVFEEAFAYFDVYSFDGNKLDDVAAAPLYIEDHGYYAYAVYYATVSASVTKTAKQTYEFTLFDKHVVTIVKEDSFVDVNLLVSLINSDPSKMSDSDITTLKKINEVYAYLTESDRNLIDLEKAYSVIAKYNELNNIDEPIERYSENTSNDDAPSTNPTNKGCKGLSSSSILLLALTMIIYGKRKYGKDR